MENAVFEMFSLGLATNRDAWVYNFSKDENVGIPEAIHSGIQAQKVAKYIGNFSTQLDYENTSKTSKSIIEIVV